MQTDFTIQQLLDPAQSHSEAILRKCVHCGFCTATCPTYQLLGDELDSPRGRVYLIKDMLEKGRPADQKTVEHIDRCLSCLSCMTTCPSGVHYMHLVDHARAHIEQTYKRPLLDRVFRDVLALILPYPDRFRFALHLASLSKPFGKLFSAMPALKPMHAMLKLAPKKLPKKRFCKYGVFPAIGKKRYRVAIHSGCAQRVLDPDINSATVQLLTRFGVEVVVLRDEVCCGSLVHHMGREEKAEYFAVQNIKAWTKEIDGDGLDAIIITVSGCGTTIKDYGHMLRNSSQYAKTAKNISEIAKDITEFLELLELPKIKDKHDKTLAYHSACSMQHGQKIIELPRKLLRNAGFQVSEIPEGHLCCGSAGTYNIMQSGIAEQLKRRKIHNIKSVNPDIIASGNIGCITQLSTGMVIPIYHTVELLNWAYGGKLSAK
ncbi:MAG: glycolate oxidase subunit GlcF [Hyphomicrobiales bacterium]|nr:glycolate oxidase subunit GlcF [Hyphomicrobiales bacterium]